MIADVSGLLCAIATTQYPSSHLDRVPVLSLEKHGLRQRVLCRLGFRSNREVLARKRLGRLIQSHRPRVVVTNYLIWSLQFSEVLNRCGATILCHTHGWDQVADLRWQTPPYHRVHPENYRQRITTETGSWHFLANSQYSIEALCHLGIDRERIHLKPFGYSGKGNLCAAPERIRFLFLGRLIDCKGPLETIRAFEIACQRGLDAELVIAGEGPLYEACTEACKTSKYHQQIRLLGKVSEQEGQQLRLSSTAFVAHSRTGRVSGQTEAFGVAFLEAIADGLPVITGASGGVTEIITNGKSGILFEPGDIEAQACALLAIANDHNLRARLHAGALAEAQRYTTEGARARLRQIIQSFLT